VEKLSTGDWSLIARCLDDEASDADLADLRQLLMIHPGLHDWIQANQLYIRITDLDFDTHAAFAKLHYRFKDEDLI
jgi:hypothetical protein